MRYYLGTKLLKNVELLGHDTTIRTVIDAVLKLCELRKDLIDQGNERTVIPAADQHVDEVDASDSEGSEAEGEVQDEVCTEQMNGKKIFKVDGCHVELLQLCPCRSAAACTCEPDERVPDTIF